MTKRRFSILDLYKNIVDYIKVPIHGIRDYYIQMGLASDGFGMEPCKLIVTYYDYSVYEYNIQTYKDKREAVKKVNDMIKPRRIT